MECFGRHRTAGQGSAGEHSSGTRRRGSLESADPGRRRQRPARILGLALSGLALSGILTSIFGAGVAIAAEAPVNETPPTISGLAKDAQKLKAAPGTWSSTDKPHFSYRWERCDSAGESCTTIPGADVSGYKATSADVTHTLRVVVTATAAETAEATSAPTDVVAALAPTKGHGAKISGSDEDGQPLTVSNGAWKGTTPLAFSYRWEVCVGKSCTPVTGATSATYRPVSSQIGARLRAIVTAKNAAGSASTVSARSKKIVPGPPVNLAAPTITGSLEQAQTLTADPGTWVGTGPLAYTYQWERCALLGGGCEPIAGATEQTYALGALDVASKLAVVVTATGAVGSASAESAETQPVLALLPANSVPPSISGLLQDGGLLSVVSGVWSGTEPISYKYQWQLCNALGEACTDIAGATGVNLPLSAEDIGKTLDVVVTASNPAGESSVTSSLTSLIAGILPSNTVLPSITGLLKDGGLLSVGSGTWTGSSPISYSYQWQLCNALGEACANVSEATGSTFSLAPTEIGKTLDVIVTASNAAGESSVTTSLTGLIAGILPSNTVLPSITGVLKEGQLLSVGSGTWTGSAPISYKYQWQLCNALGKACANVPGATEASFKLLAGDIGSTLDVIVTATNVAGESSVTSSLTGLIAGIVPSNTVLPVISGLLTNGSLLSVSSGTWTGSEPITYAYQWQLCNALTKACSNISEAVSATLKLSLADVGGLLDVLVTAKNAAGSTAATSGLTSLIGL